MTEDLSKLQMKALKDLRDECDYEDGRVGGTDNFITRGRLSAGIGVGTLKTLCDMGLVQFGADKWSREEGYRITSEGRKALKRV